MKRIMFLISLVFLSALCFPAVASTADINFSDVKGHWAEEAILRWAEEGVVQGADGKFRPNDTVTRAELTVILNRLLKYPDLTDNPFSDIKESDWYYQAAINFQGQNMLHTDGKFFHGSETLQRQEAVFMIANAFGVKPKFYYTLFQDLSETEEWAQRHVQAMKSRDYINGNPDGTFAPTANITRAETVTILNNMIDLHIDKPGVYENLIEKKVLVSSPDVTIKNSSSIHLFVSPGVGAGKVFVEKITRSADNKPSYYHIVGISDKTLVSDERIGQSLFDFTKLAGNTIVDLRFDGGDGTKQNPYKIANETQLLVIKDYGEYEYRDMYSSEHFVLTNDISLKEPWVPFCLAGQFDGCGFTIKNMNIYYNGQGEVTLGLFSRVESNATVKNLSVQGEINVIDNRSSKDIGAIAGYLGGTVSNCHTDVNISTGAHKAWVGGIAGNVTGRIENCSASGKINAVSQKIAKDPLQSAPEILSDSFSIDDLCRIYVGGIAAQVFDDAVVAECESYSAIYIDMEEISGYLRAEILAGGICGYLRGKIENSLSCNPGAVSIIVSGFADGCIPQGSVGGAVGRLGENGRIILSQAGIDVNISGSNHATAGGLVGSVLSTNLSEPTVAHSYATGQAKAENAVMQNDAGGLIGHMEGGFVTECWSGGSAVTSGNPIWLNATGGFMGACYEGGTGIMHGGYKKYETKRENNIISNCYTIASASSSGGTSVLGGFVGRVFGTFDNCYCAGTSNANSFIGATGISAGDATFRECGDFLNNARGYPLFASLTNSIEKTTKVTYGELTKQNTYTTRKWDFNSVWMMPASGSYKLPILRNADQNAQMNNPQPAHIR